MKILCVDIGTGTQDIFLYDSNLDIENGFKLVLPSPTMMINREIRKATLAGKPLLLTGVTMGGGPSQWASEDHLKAGYDVFVTPDAGRTFNDDLTVVSDIGFSIIEASEVKKIKESAVHIELKDLDLDKILLTFDQYSVDLSDLKVVSAAVFDHGNAPPGYSDRQFRFDYLESRIAERNNLRAFAYLAQDIPPIMTRMEAVFHSFRRTKADLGRDLPLVLMDTAPASVLGALYDPVAGNIADKIVLNIGNFHTLAFRLNQDVITGLFEHHTGLLDQTKLEELILRLGDGRLTHQEVFSDHGHGALVLPGKPVTFDREAPSVVVTGPRRNLLRGFKLNTYSAVPFGDMMLSGCFGLLSAVGNIIPDFREMISQSLQVTKEVKPPWEIE